MEVLAAAVAEPFRLLFVSITARVKNQFKIHSNYRDLEKMMKSLCELKRRVDRDEELLYTPRTEVGDWSRRVEELKSKLEPVQAAVTTNNGEFGCIRSLDCILSRNIVRWLEQANQLIAEGRVFQNNPAPEAVQHIPGPSVVGQSTASRNLEEIMSLLKDDGVKMIGVWGMGGVGKTHLILNLNNELEKSPDTLFRIVIWVVVSRHGTCKTIQTRIAERLGMTIGKDESEEGIRCRLCRKLKEGRFLLILDDLWSKINLDKVGIPRLDQNHIGCKIIITSRSLEVCNRMGTAHKFKIYPLSYDESWELFAQKVGEEVFSDEEIKLLAEKVVRECHGLPLALTVVGASMTDKRRISQWEDALDHLKRSEPLDIDVEEEVFKPLKWSYDCLENTQDEPLKACFLFFCLFAEDYESDVHSLAQYWLAEGLLDEHKNYKELVNRCDTIVQRLKDSCLFESGIRVPSYVRMHDVVRDVGIWIASSSDEYKSLILAGASETQVSVQKELVNCSSRVKKVSFMSSGIKSLPACEVKCPKTSTLFLQYNGQFLKVPYSFLKGFQALRILDLSGSYMNTLPHSLADLCQLRALFLCFCTLLSKLPSLASLGMLQVLDCSHSGITKLPHGFEKLTNLRLLNLSGTSKLKSIPAEKISKLCSLEYLDLSYSAAQCGFCKVNEDEMEFEELLDLNHLMDLRIRFKDIPNRFELLLGTQVRNNASFTNLRELHLSHCSISVKTSHLGQCVATCDLMPNLETLWLDFFSGLESISEFSNFLGLRFTKLRSINVSICKELEHVLVMDNGIILQELQSVFIDRCMKLKEVFKNTSSYSFAPKLKHMTLKGLPELVKIIEADNGSLCGSLKSLDVRGCDMLRKLPLGIQNAQCIERIVGEQEWWDKLEWDSQDSKMRLQSTFKNFTTILEDGDNRVGVVERDVVSP